MKIKILILLVVSAIITLSFTFISSKTESKKVTALSSSNNGDAPAGGFSIDEK